MENLNTENPKMVRWHKAYCSDCGQQYNFSRSEPKDLAILKYDSTCSDCKDRDNAFNDGYTRALEYTSKLILDVMSGKITAEKAHQMIETAKLIMLE